MKIKELRLGNSILHCDTIVYVSKLSQYDKFHLGVNYKAKEYEANLHDCKGINLTEEWLLKFGFEKDDSGVEVNDPDYCEWYQKTFPIIGELCQSSDKTYLFDTETDTLRIEYVHQLENLYFALTGNELLIIKK